LDLSIAFISGSHRADPVDFGSEEDLVEVPWYCFFGHTVFMAGEPALMVVIEEIFLAGIERNVVSGHGRIRVAIEESGELPQNWRELSIAQRIAGDSFAPDFSNEYSRVSSKRAFRPF
jgi:hypothetical protein